MIEIEYEIRKPDVAYDVEAEWVAGWTQGEHMLPKSSEEIYSLFQRGRSVLVYKLGQRNPPLAHAAITAIYPDQKVEIGSIIVNPDHRHKGLGTVATLAICQLGERLFPGFSQIALANPASAGLFTKLGAKQLSTAEVCSEVWEFCQSCPKLPQQTAGEPFACCDKLYDLDPIRNTGDALLYLGNMLIQSWMSTYVWRDYVPPHR